MTQPDIRALKGSIGDADKKPGKVSLDKLLENRELRQACNACRISVYWEGEDKFFRGTITSCRKAGSKLAFHVEYDDGDTDVEALGEAGTAFQWHGPRARSGDPPYMDAMHTAMSVLRPQNLHDEADPIAQAPAASTSGDNLTGHAAVGWRVSLWWAGTREWVEGEVLAYKESKRRHHVVFADGEDEWLSLEQERVRWLGNTRQRGTQLRPIAFGLEGGAAVPKGRDAVKWRVGVHSAALGKFVRAEIAEFDCATGRHRVEFLESATGEREWLSLTAAKVVWRFPPGHLGADSEPATPAASAAPESSGATVDRSAAGDAASSGSHKRDKTPGPTSSAKRQKVCKGGKSAEGDAAARKSSDKDSGGAAGKKGSAPQPPTPATAKPGKAGCTRSATSQSPEKAAPVAGNNTCSTSGMTPGNATAAAPEAADKPARRPSVPVPAARSMPPPHSGAAGKSAQRRDSVDGKDACGKKRRMQAPPPRPHLAAAAAHKATRPIRDYHARPRRSAHDDDSDDVHNGGFDDHADASDSTSFAQRFFAESFTRATRDLQRTAADFNNDPKALLAATEARTAFLRNALSALQNPDSFWVPCQPQRTAAAAAAAAAATSTPHAAALASPQHGAVRAVGGPLRPPPQQVRAPAHVARPAQFTAGEAAGRAAAAPHATAATGSRPVYPATAAVAMAPPRAVPPHAQGAPRRPQGNALPRAQPPPLRAAATGVAAAPRVAAIALPPTAASAAAAAAATAAAAPPPRLASAAAAEGTCVPQKTKTPPPQQPAALPKASPTERVPSAGHNAPTNGVRDVAQLLSSASKSSKLGQKPHRVSVGGGLVTPPSGRAKSQQAGRTTPPNGNAPTLPRIVLEKPAVTCGQQAAIKAPAPARAGVVGAAPPAQRISGDGGTCASAAATTAGGARPWSSTALPAPIGLKGGSAGSGGPGRAG